MAKPKTRIEAKIAEMTKKMNRILAEAESGVSIPYQKELWSRAKIVEARIRTLRLRQHKEALKRAQGTLF